MQDGPALEPPSVPRRLGSGVSLVLEGQWQQLVLDVLDTIRVFFLSIFFFFVARAPRLRLSLGRARARWALAHWVCAARLLLPD
jgi:hypothetical protein